MANAYGNIGDLKPTGASRITAQADRLSYSGVQASHTMANTDLGRMSKYKTEILQAARGNSIDPALIAAIISRETRAGNGLDSRGEGDHGNGFGLMQVDKRYHTPGGGPYSFQHIQQGTQILVDSIQRVQSKFPSWTRAQQLQGGVAAYNFGYNNVRSWEHLDVGTTSNDYSNDVVARAQFYHANGYN